MNDTKKNSVGSRITRRREELGLTVEELARRAQMSTDRVEKLEHGNNIIGMESLADVARIMTISGWALLGDEDAWPSSVATDAAVEQHPALEELSERECRLLIAPGGVGRVVFVGKYGPAAFPVNYIIYHGEIVFRTAEDGSLAALVGERIGFEVDDTTPSLRKGWSVLAVGRLERVRNSAELTQIYRSVEPWAGSERRLCLRLHAERITGRRVHPAAEAQESASVTSA